MNKRIGIITTFKANNYGAELQANAIQQKLRNIGYDAELIDYLFYKNRRYRYTQDSKPWTNFTLKQRVKNYVLYRVLLPFIEIIGNRFSKKMQMRTFSFLKFHEQYSNMSQTYCSQKVLYEARLNYDVYCVGSDQVWNPASAISIEPYFLTFAPKGAKKISYASSFGVSSVPEETKGKYRDCLSSLHSISCREKQGVQLVEELTGRKATQVLDPTLLLDENEWRRISETRFCPEKGKYILLYNIVELPVIYDFAERISRETGWPIIKLCKRALLLKRYKGVRNLSMAGPADFLGLVDNAGIFLTNSFHGVAFAINMRTPFWALIDHKQKNNSRIQSILSLLNLEERMLSTDCDVHSVDYMATVDFGKSHALLGNERKKSLEYLINAIED